MNRDNWNPDWDDDDPIEVTINGKRTVMNRIEVEEHKAKSIERSTRRTMVWLGKGNRNMARKKAAETTEAAEPVKQAPAKKKAATKAAAKKAPAKKRAMTEVEKVKAAKIKEKADKAKEKERAAKTKAEAAKQKIRDKAEKAPSATVGDIKISGKQRVCLDYIVANPGCTKLAPADLVDNAENHHRTGYACVNALIKKGLVTAKEKMEGGRRRYFLHPTKLATPG